MSSVLAALLTVILFSPEAHGKTITGYFRSETARRQNGQFITRFMYQGNINDGDKEEDSVIVMMHIEVAMWKRVYSNNSISRFTICDYTSD